MEKRSEREINATTRSQETPEGERSESSMTNHLPPLDTGSAKRDEGKAKYVTVTGGHRRIEVPDGQGYLKEVETTPSNGLPDGRYDLSKALEAKAAADRTYDGHVLHKDKEHVFHLVGEEIVKHSLFDLAKQTLPDIGARLTVAYSAGVGQVAGAAATVDTASVEPREVAGLADARRDVEALFRMDPRALSHERAAAQQLDHITTRANASADYAADLKKFSPDLFNQLANENVKASVTERERMVKAIEVVERVDQAKTVSELAGRREGQHSEPEGHQREKEKRGFSVPDPIRTSVEARVQAARDLLNQSHTLQPMYASKQQKEHAHSRQPSVPKVKRGMSR